MMDEQFMAIHQNPDIIIATPGRLLHVIMEMNLTLKSVEYVVFDEGDRLLELGFADQLTETLHRLPLKRQTLIFSATLPGALLEFARAGLSEPALIRLDVDTKLSNRLKLAFISCLPFEKEALLIYLLQNIIPRKERVIIFLATKHHVDYLELLLKEFHIDCTVVHSGLDPVARNMAVRNFRHGRVRCLLVTDLAARGIDLPLLDTAINFHFPAQAKLFVHRVGRVARAGRSGMAISLVDSEELPYLMDLYVFLGGHVVTNHHQTAASEHPESEESWPNELLGSCPRDLIAVDLENVAKKEKENAVLASASQVCKRALKKYTTTRLKASAESVRRAKEVRADLPTLRPHPIFAPQLTNFDTQKEAVLEILRNRKVPTIFEALGKTSNPEAYQMMQKKRKLHDKIISKVAAESEAKRARLIIEESERLASARESPSKSKGSTQSITEEIAPARGSSFFVPLVREDEAAERALSTRIAAHDVSADSFARSAEAARLDVQGDEVGISYGRPAGTKKSLQVWDRKKKRFVNADVAAGKANVARIKTESGVFIPASYKTDKYKTWLNKSKAHMSADAAGGGDTGPGKSAESAPTRPKEKFTSLFNARYGSVVEFMDSDNDEGGEGKLYNRRSGTQWSKKSKKSGATNLESSGGQVGPIREGGRGVKVVGTMSRFSRTALNAAKREALKETRQIRQAKGSRTFGQMRKPEQVLKQRRRMEKQKQFRIKNRSKKGGNRSGKSKQRHRRQ
uniref:RNA helicase n=1 Tax=Mesocestoides corti TaxID=53468 RepID=A0A5K3ERP3_MESCO